MAIVTDAIKMPKIKEFLDLNFPKPKISLPELNSSDAEYFTPKRFAGVEGTMVDLYIKINMCNEEKVGFEGENLMEGTPEDLRDTMHQIATGIVIFSDALGGSLQDNITNWRNSKNAIAKSFSAFCNKKFDDLTVYDYFALAEFESIFRGGPFSFINTPASVMLQNLNYIYEYGENINYIAPTLNQIEKVNDEGHKELLLTLLDASLVFDRLTNDIGEFKNKKIVAGGDIAEISKTIDRGDWDLLVDKTLFDMKNTKNYKFTLEQWRQLITYFLLSYKKYNIDSIGIWYTRFGVKYTISLDKYFADLKIDKNKLDELHNKFLKI